MIILGADSIGKTKVAARAEARQVRGHLFDTAPKDVAEDLARHLLSLIKPHEGGEVIAGYWPVGSEIDPRSALRDLARRGHETALPVCRADQGGLLFRKWQAGEPLVAGLFGEMVPDESAPEVRPRILLVPLLAYDGEGYRLGQGGGHYDRAISQLRSSGGVLAVGLAFAGQLVDRVPRENHDQPLDMMVTETGIHLAGGRNQSSEQ